MKLHWRKLEVASCCILLIIYSELCASSSDKSYSSTFGFMPLMPSRSRTMSRSQPSFPNPFTEEPNGLMVQCGKYVAARSLSSEQTRKRSRLFSSVSWYASVREMSCCSTWKEHEACQTCLQNISNCRNGSLTVSSLASLFISWLMGMLVCGWNCWFDCRLVWSAELRFFNDSNLVLNGTVASWLYVGMSASSSKDATLSLVANSTKAYTPCMTQTHPDITPPHPIWQIHLSEMFCVLHT